MQPTLISKEASQLNKPMLVYNIQPDLHNHLFNIDASELAEPIKETIEACLSADYNYDYDELLAHLQLDQIRYITEGFRLHLIQKKKLYLARYKTFTEFCKHELHRSWWAIRTKVLAADVALQLVSVGFTVLPHNISQCVALWESVTEVLPIGLAWQQVLDTYQPWEITATKIKQLLCPVDTDDLPANYCRIPYYLFSEMSKEALRKGLSLIDYIEMLHRSMQCVNFLVTYLLFNSA